MYAGYAIQCRLRHCFCSYKSEGKGAGFIAWCVAPDFTQLPPDHMTFSFIIHLNSLGSIQPSCHFRSTELFKHTSLHCPTRYPLTPGSRECACEQSALPRSTTSEYIQRSQGSNPRSLACRSRTLPLSHDAPHTAENCIRLRGSFLQLQIARKNIVYAVRYSILSTLRYVF